MTGPALEEGLHDEKTVKSVEYATRRDDKDEVWSRGAS